MDEECKFSVQSYICASFCVLLGCFSEKKEVATWTSIRNRGMMRLQVGAKCTNGKKQ